MGIEGSQEQFARPMGQEDMAEHSISRFDDPGAYEAGFGDAGVNLMMTGPGDFEAELLRLKLEHLVIMRLREWLPRIACISLAADRVFLSFPVGRTRLECDGFAFQSDQIAFHGPGLQMHQRSGEKCQWGLISLPLDQLANSGAALTGHPILPPHATRLLHPIGADLSRFQHLFRHACHLATPAGKLIEQPEVARALEQDMLHAIVHCLASDGTEDRSRTRSNHTALMARFETALRKSVGRKVTLPDLCAEIGVAERTLRMCCRELLGVSPMRYLLLRRLNNARAALRHADPSTASVASIAREHQFFELGRFAATYRAAFGEAPLTTLQRNAS
ncbi:helix-turn-helix transcriptional regulator [Bradyrhizobium sp. Pear77]|uniref:helix-turn-helix transcriptional regulator n=1 Tax=Bradyrhizobium altum TaxID=1571202 RepID=UPI001E472DC3|nr:helix-turn-helix transcriptional regulator [Bradyrhizobium altum]MCC8955401.1 helix-turn-helix transcriptional regulator [Bradyrhizobium altum]